MSDTDTPNGVNNVTLMSLNQMIDLALGVVQPGVIHFDVLHQLLRALIYQLNLTDLRVQMQGKRSVELQQLTNASQKTSRVTITSMPHPFKESTKIFPNSRTSYSQYKSGTDTSSPQYPGRLNEIAEVQSPRSPEYGPSAKEINGQSIPIVTKGRKSGEKAMIPASRDKASSSYPQMQKQSSRDSNIIVMENGVPKEVEHTVSVTVEQVQWLFDAVHSLQNQIAEIKYLPSNQDLLDKIRNGGPGLSPNNSDTKSAGSPKPGKSGTRASQPGTSKPGTSQPGDLQLGALKSGALPPGVSRLSASQPGANQSGTPQAGASEPGALQSGDTPGSIPPTATRSQTAGAVLKSGSQSQSPLGDMFQMLSLTRRVDAVEETVTKYASLLEDVLRDVPLTPRDVVQDVESLSDLQGRSINTLGNKTALDLLAKEIKNLKRLILGDDDEDLDELGTAGANLHTKMMSMEVRTKQLLDQVTALDRITAEQITSISAQCATLEDNVALIDRKLGEYTTKQNYPIISLGERCTKIEDLIDQVTSQQQRVLDGEDGRDLQISALLEQLEVLKLTKVNKEDFLSALDKKLDAEELCRKVSLEQFATTYDDLRVILEETIAKLSTQEEHWQKALLEVQGEIVTKLEKNEMVALQDFVKDKLKILQEKLRAMKMYQKEQEAAATKQKLMKNLRCLSCDAEVVAKPKLTTQDYPRSPTLPPTKTIAPYLAYELDALRKQQRGVNAGKNLHHFEAVLRTKGDRIENRYCGGPHTLTTPVQRVTRVGHFIEQWGPELTTASDKLFKGTDGNVYIGCQIGDSSTKIKPKPSLIVASDIIHERGNQTDFPEKDENIQRSQTRFKKQEVKESSTTGRGSVKGSTNKLTQGIKEPVAPAHRKSVDNEEAKPLESHTPKKISAFSFDDDPNKFPYL